MRIPFCSTVLCPGSSCPDNDSLAADPLPIRNLPAGAAPNNFILGPRIPYASPTAAELRHMLAQGERFDSLVDARITSVCGQRLTPQGLTRLFSRLWPAAQWSVNAAHCDGKGVIFQVSAWDRAGALLYQNVASAWRWSDDALEFHMQTAYVQASARDLGLQAACETLGQDILRALCPHPDARCTLAVPAQAYDGAHCDAARRGYMFADTFGMESPAGAAAANSKQAFTAAFVAWLEGDASLQVQGSPPSSEELAQLRAQANASYQPREFLQIGLGGATALAPGSGSLQRFPVGEAFLRSGSLPAWCAVRFVNSLGPHANGRVGQLRAQSQVCCGVSLKRELSSALGRTQSWRQGIWDDLGNADPQRRAAAYLAVGMHAPAGLRGMLRERMPRRNFRALLPSHAYVELDPTARQALEQAVALMDGFYTNTNTNTDTDADPNTNT